MFQQIVITYAFKEFFTSFFLEFQVSALDNCFLSLDQNHN